MSTFRRRLLLKLYKLSDVFILIAALLFTTWLITYQRSTITLSEFLSLRIRVINFIGLLGMISIWHFLFNSFQLYRSRRLDSGIQEWKDILKATTAGMAIFMIIGLIFNITAFTPLFIALFWMSSTIITISFRSLMRFVLGMIRLRGRNLRFVLIAGTNQRAYDFARMIEDKKELGYSLVGFIDKDVYRHHDTIALLGTLDDFPRVLENHIVDEVVIALPIKSYYEEIQNIVEKAEEQGIMIHHLSHLFDTKVAQSKAGIFEDFPVMTMASGPQEGWSYMAKRIIDVLIATVFMVATSPLMIVAAITITVQSPGPVLFVQKRVGYNKRVFKLYKFRTMVEGAETMQIELESRNEMDGPVFKIHDDPRITSAGRWLRKFSVDELPQLFNVLKGDMSLVGPRPLPVRDYSGFDKDWQRRRFSVLPGITCTWQVNGRNDITFEDWMKMDMEYIDNWKLSDDFKILFKTIPAVIRGRGAV